MVKKKVKRKTKKEFEDELFEKCKPSHIAIGIFALLFFSLLVGFVNLKNPTITGNPIWNIFDVGDIEDTALIARYIFFLTFIGLIYWAFDLIIEEKYALFKVLIAMGVSYLSVSFILTNEMITILSAYSALGVFFMIALPFVTILLLTARMLTRGRLNVVKVMVQRVLWGGYSVFLLYYIITNTNLFGFTNVSWLSNPEAIGSSALGWVIILVVAVSTFFFIKNDFYVDSVMKLSKSVKDSNRRAKLAEEKRNAAEAHARDSISNIVAQLEGSNIVSNAQIESFRNLMPD